MSRHYRELLEGHVTGETVYHRPPYTVAIVETEWGEGDEFTRITGCGVAKHNPADTEAGHPYDERLDELRALGRAYQDAYQAASVLGLTDGSPQHPQCRCCAEPAAYLIAREA